MWLLCQVSDHTLIYQKDFDFEKLDEEEVKLYKEYYKKALAGKFGSMVAEVEICNKDLLNRIFYAVDDDNRDFQELCERIEKEYITKEDYCILAAYGYYEIPSEEMDDIYTFLLITIHPCPLSKPGIMVDFMNKSLVDRVQSHELKMPSFAFLYPSFHERTQDPQHLYYNAKNETCFPEMNPLMKTLFGSSVISDAEKQKRALRELPSEGFGESVPYEVYQNLYAYMGELKKDQELSGQTMPVSAYEIVEHLMEIHPVSGEQSVALKEKAKELSDISFYPDVIAPKKMSIRTELAEISIPSEEIANLRKKVVEGREYLLIPADHPDIR